MSTPRRIAGNPLADFVNLRWVRWRTGTTEGQIAALVVLIVLVAFVTIAALLSYERISIVAFFLPLLIGSLALRFNPLVVLFFVSAGALGVVVGQQGMTSTRLAAVVMMALGGLIILAGSSRIRSGLPGPLSEAMLLDLRDRLYAQGRIPPLPDGWLSQSAMKSAGGAKFGGDFMVAELSDDAEFLDMILVDVCGKGVAAGTQSLHFAGALGGLIGSLPPEELILAANRFLLRQNWLDGFATAVHVRVNLVSGDYVIISAGHPPALKWSSSMTEWLADDARGTALGITEMPDIHTSPGHLGRGDALMFYTDGVVETREMDLTSGIEALRSIAAAAVSTGFDNAPKRILARVSDGRDDRAVLILSRDA